VCRLCLALIVAGLSAVAAERQVFRARRTTVVVPVTVLDKDGYLVIPSFLPMRTDHVSSR
jgi:hypothetical protein